MKSVLALYKRPITLLLFLLLVLSCSRLMLVGLHWGRVTETGGLAFIFLQGLRFDLILSGMLFGMVLVLKPWLHTNRFTRGLSAWLVPLYLASVLTIALYTELSTAPFIEQFDNRPNYIAVEYLKYPREVFATIAGLHFWKFLMVSLLCTGAFVSIFRWLRSDPENERKTTFLSCLWITPLVLVLVVFTVRSKLAHRPVNPSNAAFSQDAMVNQLPLNSLYTVLYAIYEKRRAGALDDLPYGLISDEEALSIVLAEAGIEPEAQLDPEAPTLHFQAATSPRDKPLNLVIVVEESLGAEFVGSLGGKDLTPNLDSLADEGIWFERMYATGIRSARGLEAIISGFTPTHLQSVIKLTAAQSGFFTLASLLERQGYRTSFIYGGESHFDNMRRFFLHNGFQKLVDESDYDDPVYHGAWGVSDEDMFNRGLQELNQPGDQPFFSVMFTTSNHEPFDIPADRVTDSEYGLRETSIKYADYALGEFMKQARQSPSWGNTVFVILADHNAKIFGGALVPVERFRVPAVILGPDIEPRKVAGITSQIDLVPTLLSLIGISSEHPGIGRDLTLPQWQNGSGRALMQFHANQAYIENERVIILQPDLPIESRGLGENGYLIPDGKEDEELKRKALAYSAWGPLMIRTGAYRLSKPSEAATSND